MYLRLDLTLIHPPSLKPEEWLRFVELEPFPRQWERLKLTDDDLAIVQVILCAAPKMGKVISGTDGLRKGRFATERSDQGKSGSFRIFYVYFQEYGIVALWSVIAKNEKADMSKADRNAIATVNRRLRRLLGEGMIR